MTLAQKICDLRSKKAVKQAEAARKMNISIAALSSFENGQRVPSLRTLNKIAQYYSVEPDSLINDERAVQFTDNQVANEFSSLFNGGLQETNGNKMLIVSQILYKSRELFSIRSFNENDFDEFVDALTQVYRSIKEVFNDSAISEFEEKTEPLQTAEEST